MVARHKGLTFSRKVAVEFLLTENPSGIINGITSAYTYNPIVSVVFLFQVVNTLRGKALLFVPSPLNIYAETRTLNMCLDLCFTTDFFATLVLSKVYIAVNTIFPVCALLTFKC